MESPLQSPGTRSTGQPPLSPTQEGAAIGPAEGKETPIWTGRTSWRYFALRMVVWVLGVVLAGVAVFGWVVPSSGMSSSSALLLYGAVGLIWTALLFGSAALVIWGNRYRLTTERLVIERGILSQTIDQTELIRVDDVRIYKSVMERVFGLGSVAVLSTDATDREIMIPGIADSEQVAETIRTRMRALRSKKSLFVENL